MTPDTSWSDSAFSTDFRMAIQCSVVMWSEGMLKRLSTRTFATFASSGTPATRSSPDSAGTGAFFTGSIFIAIVPPVAIMWQTRRS
jgi:hypothetical protein